MKRKILASALLCVMLLTSCTGGADDLPTPPNHEFGTTAGENNAPAGSQNSGNIADFGSESAESVDIVIPDGDMFTDRDIKSEYDSSKSNRINLDKATSQFVTISEDGTYVLSGTLDGTVIVDAKSTDKLHLILDGVSIHSESSAALYIKSADKVVITLAGGSENSLSSGESFVAIDDSNIDSALFSRDDLTINGTGSLTVTAPAGHGIVCKDDLVLTGGKITVNSASHGIDVNDSVRIASASITVDSGKDGVHVENTDDASLGFFYMESGSLAIECEGDGIDAASYASVKGGSFTFKAGGGYKNGENKSSSGFGGFMGGGFGGGGRPGSNDRGGSSSSTSTDDSASTSMKGIKASLISIEGGSFTIDSADDALHSNGRLTVSGGVFEIASGDDALHAEEDLTVSSGVINITNSYEGLEALHITVSSGDIRLTSTDDGLNAAGGVDSSGTTGGRDGMFGGGGGGGRGGGMFGGSSDGSITISGGDLYINSSGDGIDANGTLRITGGCTVVVGPTMGDTATLDYEVSAVISGGTFIGTGAGGMAQTFSSSENQGVIALSVGNCAAGTKITLEDAAGCVILEHAPELNFAVVILSSPDMQKGEEYTVKIGELSGTFEAE